MKIRQSAVAIFVFVVACLGASQAVAQGHRPPPGRGYAPPPHAAPRGQWWDGAYGHGRYYPVAGYRVGVAPAHAHWVPWGGVRYGYWGGAWYAPYGGSYVVVRPPFGVVISTLPVYATAVTLGGVGYWYANGSYYRDYAGGGYEVVPSPLVGAPEGNSAFGRTYIYPKSGQSAEKQASDEYECHRWAVGQTGFDPTAAATGQITVSTLRSDYVRAQGACLEGRGYTVR